jgi:hypothetical protein
VAHPLTAIPIHVETEETHLCHSANEVHGEGPLVEMVSNERHAFLIHKVPNPVSIKPLCFCQKRFSPKIIDHIFTCYVGEPLCGLPWRAAALARRSATARRRGGPPLQKLFIKAILLEIEDKWKKKGGG